MKITLLGTGNAIAGAERENTYFLMEYGDRAMMIDVGGGPLQRLKKIGVDQGKVDTVFFTHFHIDHIYGLPSLLWGMWIVGRKAPLTIYCPASDLQRLNQYLEVIDITGWPLPFELDIRGYQADERGRVDWHPELTIHTVPAVHSVPTAGLEIMLQDKRVVYAADTMLNQQIRQLGQIDCLIHEATSAKDFLNNHSSLAEMIDYYHVEEKIGQLVCVHLTDGQPYQEVLDSQSATVRAKCQIGYDYMTITP